MKNNTQPVGAHTPLPWQLLENYPGGIPLSIAETNGNRTIARIDWHGLGVPRKPRYSPK